MVIYSSYSTTNYHTEQIIRKHEQFYKPIRKPKTMQVNVRVWFFTYNNCVGLSMNNKQIVKWVNKF